MAILGQLFTCFYQLDEFSENVWKYGLTEHALINHLIKEEYI